MKKHLLLITIFSLTIFFSKLASSQQTTLIKGFVYNSESNEPIPGANLIIPGTQTGTGSDDNGYFNLSLPIGSYNIRVTAIGFSEKRVDIIADGSQKELRIGLSPRKHEIGEVEIFGHYFLPDRDTSVNRVPVSILPTMTTISALEIERQGATTLVDAMKYVTGGWTETRGRKTKQFFTVRGQKYPYPDYSINGVWQKEFEETSYFLSALDIESIEIVRSSSALVKGLSGLTGVVDIKTKVPERESLTLLAKYGELNSYISNVQYGNKINDFSFNALAGVFGTDGPKGLNGKERIGNFQGNINWKIDNSYKLQAGATYINGLRQLTSIDKEVGAPNLKNRIEKYDPVRTLLTFVKLDRTGATGSKTELQANYSYRNVDFANYNVQTEATVWNKEDDWEYGLNILHSQPLSQSNTLRVGGLYNHWLAPNGKRYYTGRSCNVHTFSGVIADEQKVGKFLFDAGFRLIGGHIVEWGGFGIEGSAAGFQNVEPIENQAAPLEWQSVVGASFLLSSSSSFHYNFAGGTIAPRKGALTDLGVDPKNEGRFQHDIGFRFKTPGKNEISISSFYAKRENALDFSGQTIVTEDDLLMELYENRDKRSYGVELSAKVNIPAINSYIFGNALLMKGEAEENGEMAKDKQLPQVILNGGLYFDYSRFDANIFVNYTGQYSNNRFVNPAWTQQHGDFNLGDFVSADFNAGYTFKNPTLIRVFVEIKNVLDQKFLTVAGYPDPGRLFLFGVKLTPLR